MNKDEIIKKASSPNGAWSIGSLSAFMGKPASHDGVGNTTLNGCYSIEELEAILFSAQMQRSTPSFQ